MAQLDDDPQQSIDKLDGLLKDLSAAASKIENIKKDKWDSFAQATDQKIEDIKSMQEECDEMLQAMQFLHNEKTKVMKAENNQVRYPQNRAIRMLSSKGYTKPFARAVMHRLEKGYDSESVTISPRYFDPTAMALWNEDTDGSGKGVLKSVDEFQAAVCAISKKVETLTQTLDTAALAAL